MVGKPTKAILRITRADGDSSDSRLDCWSVHVNQYCHQVTQRFSARFPRRELLGESFSKHAEVVRGVILQQEQDSECSLSRLTSHDSPTLVRNSSPTSSNSSLT